MESSLVSHMSRNHLQKAAEICYCTNSCSPVVGREQGTGLLKVSSRQPCKLCKTEFSCSRILEKHLRMHLLSGCACSGCERSCNRNAMFSAHIHLHGNKAGSKDEEMKKFDADIYKMVEGVNMGLKLRQRLEQLEKMNVRKRTLFLPAISRGSALICKRILFLIQMASRDCLVMAMQLGSVRKVDTGVGYEHWVLQLAKFQKSQPCVQANENKFSAGEPPAKGPETAQSDENEEKRTRTHTGDREYQCEICGKGFDQFGSLAPVQGHEQMLACHRCSKPSLLQGGLLQHLPSHSVHVIDREKTFGEVEALSEPMVAEGHSIEGEVSARIEVVLTERQKLHTAWQHGKVHFDQVIDVHFYLWNVKQISIAQEMALSNTEGESMVEKVEAHLQAHGAFQNLVSQWEEKVASLKKHADKLIRQKLIVEETVRNAVVENEHFRKAVVENEHYRYAVVENEHFRYAVVENEHFRYADVKEGLYENAMGTICVPCGPQSTQDLPWSGRLNVKKMYKAEIADIGLKGQIKESEGRPFHCAHGGKRFNQKSRLKMHMKVHTKKKPYSCSDCEKSFAGGGQLMAH